jgi:hypothetical protein
MLKHNVLRRTRDPFGFKEQGVLWFHRLEGAIETVANVNRVHRSIQKKFLAGETTSFSTPTRFPVAEWKGRER